jgi:DnaK suppressor protein
VHDRRAKERHVAYLSDDQLQQIESLLSRREAELQAEVRALKEAGVASPDALDRDVKDPADDADARVLLGLDHVQLLRDQEELRDIEDARERIRKGLYGRCVECGKPIPFARLLVKATAKYCLEHQAKWERTHPAVPPFTA